MANFNVRAVSGPLTRIGAVPQRHPRAQPIIETPRGRGNRNAWTIDLGMRLAQHRNGVRVSFVRRYGDWYPVVLLPLPTQVGAAAVGSLTRAAMGTFLDALLKTKDVANQRIAALYR